MRVLLVRFGSLGDVVLTLGAAAALRAARPEARITYLVKREYAPLVAGQAGVDEVWPLEAGDERGAAALAGLRTRVAGGGFDVAVDWQTSPRSRALLAGAPRVLAWSAERWGRRRWVALRWTRPAPVRPAWRRYADALAPLGVRPADVAPPRHVPATAATGTAAAFFGAWDAAAGDAPFVAVAPGARWATKRWPAERFAAVVAARRAAGERVLLVGDARDRAAYEAAAGAGGPAPVASPDPGVRWFAGDLAATAAVLAQARAVLANDSGLLHLAAAVGRPVVAIFASTHPGLGFGPAGAARVFVRDLSCQPCTLHGRDRCPRGHHRCATEIAVAPVDAALAAAAPERD